MNGGRYLSNVPRLRVPGVGLVDLIAWRTDSGGLELVAGEYVRRTFYGYSIRQARALFAAYLSDLWAGGAA